MVLIRLLYLQHSSLLSRLATIRKVTDATIILYVASAQNKNLNVTNVLIPNQLIQ
jgi:hypothetical protein